MGETTAIDGRLFAGRPASRWRWVLYAIGCASGLLLTFPASLTTGVTRVDLDEADVWHLHYVLEHTWRWAGDPGYGSSFWSPPCFYPTPETLAYSENLTGAAPAYWALRTVLDETAALYAWLWLWFALDYAAMLFVLRALGIRPGLSTLGAFLFAFAAPRQVQAVHLNMVPQPLAPLALYFVWQFTRRPGRKWFALAVACVLGQTFMSIHLGWFLGLGLTVWLACMLSLDRPARANVVAFLRARRLFVAGTLAAAAAGAALFFHHYYAGNAGVRRNYLEAAFFCPNVTDWFTIAPGYFWGDRLTMNAPSTDAERSLFAGLCVAGLLPAALLVGGQFGRHGAARFSLAAGLACCVLLLISFDFGDHTSLWYFAYHTVPGANAVRAVCRVWSIILPLVLMGGLAALQLLAESRLPNPAARTVVYVLLAAGCVFEQVDFRRQSWPAAERDELVRRMARQIEGADAAVFVPSTDAPLPGDWFEVSAMWAGMRVRTPTLNGYSGREPLAYAAGDDAGALARALRLLGPNWEGKLLIVDVGTTWRRTWYQVRSGPDAAGRARLVGRDSGLP